MIRSRRPVLERESPLVPMSSQTSIVFKTGSQRWERPVFANKVAPCRHACPIGVDIPSAFDLASSGDVDAALKTWLQDNPLPGVCGRVCYQPCEQACNRRDFDTALNIRSFERFLSDHGTVDVTADVQMDGRRESIAVVGSGPAGLSAAYHLARIGYHITLFEANPKLGGMMRYGIPRFRLPSPILDHEIDRILSLGVRVELGNTIGKHLGWQELESFDAVFMAVGLQRGKRIFDAGNSKARISTGVSFLANADTHPQEDLDLKTLIVGGGNVAIDVARSLLRRRGGSASGIVVICPESKEEMPALPEELREALEEGLEFVCGWAPVELHDRPGECLQVDFRPAKVLIDAESGEREIVPFGTEIQAHQTDRVIVAIGQELHLPIQLPGVTMSRGLIEVDRFGRTSHPKFFAAGDATGGKAFVADAIAGGKLGALAIHCFLENRDVEGELQTLQIGKSSAFCTDQLTGSRQSRPVDLGRIASFDQINTLFFSNENRIEPERLDPRSRSRTFDEVAQTVESQSMRQEISRCFGCGLCVDCENCIDFCPDLSIVRNVKPETYDFNSDYCKGCGMCSVACPRGVIEMEQEQS